MNCRIKWCYIKKKKHIPYTPETAYIYAMFSPPNPLSHAAYNVVKDHSGNASSAVTKYPYSKHISRACNLFSPKC